MVKYQLGVLDYLHCRLVLVVAAGDLVVVVGC